MYSDLMGNYKKYRIKSLYDNNVLTAASCLADEVALFPRSFVEQMIGRCSVEGSKIFVNCNPKSPFHYFKTEFIDKAKEKKIYYLHFTMEDNLSLAESVKERYRRMFTGTFYLRYILGKWVQAEGLVYDVFTEKKNVVKTELRAYEQFYVSCDYGTQNPMVYLLWGKLKGKWYVIKEYYYDGRKEGKQKTDDEYYKDLEEFIGNIYIKAFIIDPSASSFITLVRQKGKYNLRKAKNDVLQGIALSSSKLYKEEVYINDCCGELIKEFYSYTWDEKAVERGEDKPIKEFDHCLTGDTLVDTLEGQVPIKDLVGKKGLVYCYDTENKTKAISNFYDVRKTNENMSIFEIELEDGRKFKATEYHPVLTQRGWVTIKDLSPMDCIIDIKIDDNTIRY